MVMNTSMVTSDKNPALPDFLLQIKLPLFTLAGMRMLFAIFLLFIPMQVFAEEECRVYAPKSACEREDGHCYWETLWCTECPELGVYNVQYDTSKNGVEGCYRTNFCNSTSDFFPRGYGNGRYNETAKAYYNMENAGYLCEAPHCDTLGSAFICNFFCIGEDLTDVSTQDYCNASHLLGPDSRCESNIKEGTDDTGKYFQIYLKAGEWDSKKYYTSCNDGYHLDEDSPADKNYCGKQNLATQCVDNTHKCDAEFLRNRGVAAREEDGVFDGTATWSQDDGWDLTGCSRQRQTSDDQGQFVETCPLTKNEDSVGRGKWQWASGDKCERSYSSCANGYWKDGEDQCKQATAGYYATNDEQYPCPAGATSDAGASQKCQCFVTQGTVLQDSGGSFTLDMGNSKIYYNGGCD